MGAVAVEVGMVLLDQAVMEVVVAGVAEVDSVAIETINWETLHEPHPALPFFSFLYMAWTILFFPVFCCFPSSDDPWPCDYCLFLSISPTFDEFGAECICFHSVCVSNT